MQVTSKGRERVKTSWKGVTRGEEAVKGMKGGKGRWNREKGEEIKKMEKEGEDENKGAKGGKKNIHAIIILGIKKLHFISLPILDLMEVS